MLDRDWTAPLDLSAIRLDLPGLTVTATDPGPMTLVSGDIAAALSATGLGTAQGWPGEAQGARYAIRTGIYHALLVGVDLAGGWHGGFGATEASDALATFVLEGPATQLALDRLGEISLARPSPAASFLIAGYRAILYRHDGALRLHVSRPMADAFATHLAAVFADLRA